MVSIIYFIEAVLRNNLIKLKGKFLKLYLILHGCKVGKNLRCHEFPNFRSVPLSNFYIGSNVTIGRDITFEVLKTGKLYIGDRVKLTQNVLVSVGTQVTIGNDTLIAENVSIRDGDHQTFNNIPINQQSNIYKPILIGHDVWIGAGSIILRDSKVPDGVIIGAKSLVTHKTEIKPYTIVAGTPTRFLRNRKLSNGKQN